MDYIYSLIAGTFSSIWMTLGLMAPYLLLGYLVAGILSVFIKPAFVERHLGDGGVMSTVKAAVFGMPLPLCSCGVIPVTASLRKHGADRGATASFLISTPTTGVDSIMAAWGLMGPIFAIYRAIMAVLIGIFGGLLANFFGDEADDQAVKSKEGESCCAVHAQEADGIRLSPLQKAYSALKYGFYTLPKDIGKALAVGILAAGIISALVDGGVINEFFGNGFGTMLLMLVIGIPLYVCSTASIPLALGFISLGASPGAALVFLISGPATNAATLTVLWTMIGKRSTFAVLLAIAVGALVGGVTLDYLWGFLQLPEVSQMMHEHSAESSAWPAVAAVTLVAVQLYSAFYGRVSGWFSGEKIAGSCCAHDVAPVKTASSCCSDNTAPESKAGDSCCAHEAPKAEKSACCCGKGNNKGAKDGIAVEANKPVWSDGGDCCAVKQSHDDDCCADSNGDKNDK